MTPFILDPLPCAQNPITRFARMYPTKCNSVEVGMLKLALVVIAMVLCSDMNALDLGWIVHFKDYGMALLIALLIEPWVVQQIDS